MFIGGWDPVAAEENGFELVEADGWTVPVAVTPEAQQLLDENPWLAGGGPSIYEDAIALEEDGRYDEETGNFTPSAEAAELIQEQTGVAARGSQTAYGNCGSATLAVYYAGNRRINMSTSYSVNLPTTFHVWNVRVSAQGMSSTAVVPFSGANAAKTWTAYRNSIGPYGTSGGASIQSGSYAFSPPAIICYAGTVNPTWGQ